MVTPGKPSQRVARRLHQHKGPLVPDFTWTGHPAIQERLRRILAAKGNELFGECFTTALPKAREMTRVANENPDKEILLRGDCTEVGSQMAPDMLGMPRQSSEPGLPSVARVAGAGSRTAVDL